MLAPLGLFVVMDTPAPGVMLGHSAITGDQQTSCPQVGQPLVSTPPDQLHPYAGAAHIGRTHGGAALLRKKNCSFLDSFGTVQKLSPRVSTPMAVAVRSPLLPQLPYSSATVTSTLPSTGSAQVALT